MLDQHARSSCCVNAPSRSVVGVPWPVSLYKSIIDPNNKQSAPIWKRIRQSGGRVII